MARPVGTNDVGMVAWAVHMKTPEYPEGRDIVVVANDVTVQSGAVGVWGRARGTRARAQAHLG